MGLTWDLVLVKRFSLGTKIKLISYTEEIKSDLMQLFFQWETLNICITYILSQSRR